MNYMQVLALAGLLFVTSACEKEEVKNTEPVKSETIKDLPANPSDAPSGNKFTLFSFKNGIIANADSATTKWDIGFRSTAIIVNGGTSGPGQAMAAMASGIFGEMKAAPAEASFKKDNGTILAIPGGSGNGWYTYNSTTHEISPIAGRVFFVKTNEGKYVKFEVLSYYKGAPATFVLETAKGRYYTFRYALQPNGTPTFN